MSLNPHSIIFKTTIIFITSVCVLTFGVFMLDRFEKKRESKELREHIMPIMFSLRHLKEGNFDIQTISNELAIMGFKEIKDMNLYNEVLNNGISIRDFKKYHKKPKKDDDNEHYFEYHHYESFKDMIFKKQKYPFELKIFDNKLYLISTSQLIEPLLFEYKKESKSSLLWFVYFGVLAILIFVYIEIIRSLLPVKKLIKEMESFCNGNLDVDISIDRKDEIAQIANAFKKTAIRVKELIEARKFFIRNIMHELKTPITSGKIAVSMLESSKYKDRLEEIFKKEEKILDDFYKIESILSGTIELKKATYNIFDVIDSALDLMFDEKERVKSEIKDCTIMVDLSLFCVAIKNLLENAIKYSPNKEAILNIKDGILEIKNIGSKLEYPLEHYASVYTPRTKKERELRGFGFGLYISLNIFKLHGLKLEYEHIDGINRFYSDISTLITPLS